jgi:hypothetical protein
MTGDSGDATILFMATKGKPGRRPGTPFEYQEALRMRLRSGREDAGFDIPQMAAQLSAVLGREIPADSYRKWESESLLPHDAILAVCDIIQVHAFKFLGPVADEERELIKKSSVKKVRYLKHLRSAS